MNRNLYLRLFSFCFLLDLSTVGPSFNECALRELKHDQDTQHFPIRAIKEVIDCLASSSLDHCLRCEHKEVIIFSFSLSNTLFALSIQAHCSFFCFLYLDDSKRHEDLASLSRLSI